MTAAKEFLLKFEQYWKCLKCGHEFQEPKNTCPYCGGPVTALCRRIYR